LRISLERCALISFLREVLSLAKCALRCLRREDETDVLNFMASLRWWGEEERGWAKGRRVAR